MSDPMLEFYREHKVSPVRQDLSDLRRHFERRSFLYLHLGIPMSAIRGKSVLEVGPGSGHNAFFTATLTPSRYLLVEGNPTAIEHIESLFGQYPSLRRVIEIAPLMLEEFEQKNREHFDFVLCEAVLSGFSEPKRALPVLAKFVAPGGVLVVTTMDAASCFAEILRRFCAYLVMKDGLSTHDQVEWLLPALQPHLLTLTGMSRDHRDWIVDNILLPITGGYNFLSLADVAENLPEDMDLYYTSPRILTDWRWYKDISRENREYRTHAVREYWRSVHGLLTHREVFTQRSEDDNRRLYAYCTELRDTVVRFEETKDRSLAIEVLRIAAAVKEHTATFSSSIDAALSEAIALLRQKSFTREDLANSKAFAGFFGRTLQYVSACKRAEFAFPEAGK